MSEREWLEGERYEDKFPEPTVPADRRPPSTDTALAAALEEANEVIHAEGYDDPEDKLRSLAVIIGAALASRATSPPASEPTKEEHDALPNLHVPSPAPSPGSPARGGSSALPRSLSPDTDTPEYAEANRVGAEDPGAYALTAAPPVSAAQTDALREWSIAHKNMAVASSIGEATADDETRLLRAVNALHDLAAAAGGGNT